MFNARINIVMFATLVAAGCASVPQQKLAIDTATSKKIAVLPVGIPKVADVRVIHSSGASFGLIGAGIDAVRFNAHKKDLAVLLDQQHFDFHAAISDGVLQTVRNDGYQTLDPDPSNANSERAKWISPLPDVKDADLFLDIYMADFGYVADWETKPYLPSVDMQARLVDRSGKQLFYSRIIYNAALDVLGKSTGPKMTPDPAYAFASMDALKADPEKAKHGLESAIGAVLAELKTELGQDKSGTTASLSK